MVIQMMNRLEFTIVALCGIAPCTRYYIAKITRCSLGHINATMSELCHTSLIRRIQERGSACYHSYLTLSELKEGYEKWPDLLKNYPELQENLNRRLKHDGKTDVLRAQD